MDDRFKPVITIMVQGDDLTPGRPYQSLVYYCAQ